MSTATFGPSASTTVIANRSRPLAVAGKPQACSSPGCGSIPTHNGPRALIAVTNLAPKGSKIDIGPTPLLQCRQFGEHRASGAAGDCLVQLRDQRRSGVDESGVELQQTRPSIEHAQPVLRAGDAADPDDRQVGVPGDEAHHLDSPIGQRPTRQPTGLGGQRRLAPR